MTAPEIPAELVERMVALVRRMAIRSTPASREIDAAENKEACAIAALLPEPDQDLVIARYEAANVHSAMHGSKRVADEIRHGQHDDWILVIGTLAGIKRGRELAREQSR